MSAIEELSSIRGDANRLVKQVVETNNNLQELGNEIKDRHKDLIQCRRRQAWFYSNFLSKFLKVSHYFMGDKIDTLKPQKANINKVIDKLNESLPILRQFRRVQQMMAKRKFYSALKIMGQIEHTHLSQVEQFKFAKNIQNQFPIIKDQIIKTIQVELKDFLENIQVILACF